MWCSKTPHKGLNSTKRFTNLSLGSQSSIGLMHPYGSPGVPQSKKSYIYFNNSNIKIHKICGEKQDAFLPQQPLDPKEGFVNLSDNFSLLCATYLSAYLSHQQEKNASAFVLSRNFQNASKLANTNSQRTFRSKDVHMRGRRGAVRRVWRGGGSNVGARQTQMHPRNAF